MIDFTSLPHKNKAYAGANGPFDDLMAFSDATDLWALNESTLRKAISYGKLVDGIDVRKFGKQWVVSMEAMQREYGNPGI